MINKRPILRPGVLTRKTSRSSIILFFVLSLAVGSPVYAQEAETADTTLTAIESAAAKLKNLADNYYAFRLEVSPELAYFAGIETDNHSGLTSNALYKISSNQRREDQFFNDLKSIDAEALRGTVDWVTYGILEQSLRSNIDLRVCRSELWDINQMSGWQLQFPRIMEMQVLGNDDLRIEALRRMSNMSVYILIEIDNLKQGLKEGYSAPKSVVSRVIKQVDALMALDRRVNPLISLIFRDDSEGFLRETLFFYEDETFPALQAYRDFLANEYLAQARESLSVTANPNGRECYEAALRASTTLDRTSEEVFELGKKTVEANRARVVELGKEAYGLDSFTAVMEKVMADPSDRFADADEMLLFSREAVAGAQAVMPKWFGVVPEQAVVVEPYPDFQEGTGVSSRYEAGSATRPGVYRISRHEPEQQSKGSAEATAFHEAWPGHHLQISVAQAIEGLHPVSRISGYSGMIEGWARYSESLAAEMGLYKTVSGPIRRLAWPARGMVVDPGIHIKGWTREQAIAFMAESGRMTPGELDDMVDRIAVLPGQLTSYDSGGLEIVALREMAESTLGDQFDIKAFHDKLLENGSVPLTLLRAHIEEWLEGQ